MSCSASCRSGRQESRVHKVPLPPPGTAKGFADSRLTKHSVYDRLSAEQRVANLESEMLQRESEYAASLKEEIEKATIRANDRSVLLGSSRTPSRSFLSWVCTL